MKNTISKLESVKKKMLSVGVQIEIIKDKVNKSEKFTNKVEELLEYAQKRIVLFSYFRTLSSTTLNTTNP